MRSVSDIEMLPQLKLIDILSEIGSNEFIDKIVHHLINRYRILLLTFANV